jgi:hypothetical protein
MIIDNAEIFHTGTWPGSRRVHINESDLDDVVWAFEALRLSGRVPLKLTHEGPDQRDPEFDAAKSLAMGWVKKVWRDGKKLMATLDVPEKVHKLIKEGYLKFVSVELIPDVQAFNRLIPWVLDAVAILGADQPAVGVLKDLQSLTLQRRRAAFSTGTPRVTFKRPTSEEHTMTDDEIKALFKKQDDANTAVVKELTAKFDAAEKRAKDAEEKSAKEKEERQKETIKLKRESIDKLFNGAIEEKRFEPKVRERFAKMTRYDKDDNACEAVDIKEVEEYIKDNTRADFKASKKGVTQEGDNADEDAKLPIDEQLNKKAVEWCKQHNIDATKMENLQQAGVAVLRGDKDLAVKYQRLHVKEA